MVVEIEVIQTPRLSIAMIGLQIIPREAPDRLLPIALALVRAIAILAIEADLTSL